MSPEEYGDMARKQEREEKLLSKHDEWVSKVLPYGELTAWLNEESALGRDIAAVFAVSSTHACVVSVKLVKSELDQQILKKKGKK